MNKRAAGLMNQARPIMSMIIAKQIEDRMEAEGITREEAEKVINKELEEKVAGIKKEFYAERLKAKMKADTLKQSALADKQKKNRRNIIIALILALLGIAIATIWSGCFNPDLSEVQFTCSAENRLCIAGQSCDVDAGLCVEKTESDLNSQAGADLSTALPSRCNEGFTEKKVSARASICTGASFVSLAKPCAKEVCASITTEERTLCEQLADRALINKEGSFSSNIGATQCGDNSGIFRIRYGCGSKLRSAPECGGAVRAVVCRFPEVGLECESGSAAGAVLCC